jgi:hypothetical protein
MTMRSPLLQSPASPPAPDDADEHVVLARWTAVLNDYATSLDEQRSFLLTVRPGVGTNSEPLVIAPFEAPVDLPPLPRELLPWAQALEQETAGLIELASDYLAANRPSTTARGGFATPTNESIGDWKL